MKLKMSYKQIVTINLKYKIKIIEINDKMRYNSDKHNFLQAKAVKRSIYISIYQIQKIHA